MIVFLHIPKTAGTSFHVILENNFGISYCHTNHTKRPVFTAADVQFAKMIFPRLRALAGHNLLAPMDLLPEAFHMTFLREPVSRVLSLYQERCQVNQVCGRPVIGFEEALRTDPDLENLHVKLMAGKHDLDAAKKYLERCAFVGLTEKFDLSLHVLARIFPGRLDVTYLKRRVQQDNSIRKKLEADSKAMDMVREFNKLDIELYDFATREIFPKLCEKAGFSPDQQVTSLNTRTTRNTFNSVTSRFFNHAIYRQLCKRYR